MLGKTVSSFSCPGATTTTTVTASDSNTDTESLVKPKRNRFSVEMDGNQSPWEREDPLRGGGVKEGERESNHFESKQSLPCDLPVVKKELKEAKGSIKEKEESRSNSRRGRSPARRSTALRTSLDSSTDPSPLRRIPIKSSRSSPVKSQLADVSTTMDSVVMKCPQNEDSINLPETPSRRTRRDGSNRSLESESQKVVGVIGETRVTRVNKPIAPMSPPKMRAKEQWEVKASPSPKSKAGEWVMETEELWLCPKGNCSYMGATAAKMRLHLSCHGLDEDEVESYAREDWVMGRRLEKVSRIVYFGKAREILGSGPLTKTSGEVVGNGKVWDCRIPECCISFPSEENLLKHCKQVHARIIPTAALLASPLHTESASTAYKCFHCREIVLADVGSSTLSEHWRQHLEPLASMKFLCLASSQILTLEDIHPYSVECGDPECKRFFTSDVNFSQVQEAVLSHWSSSHTGKPRFSSLSHRISAAASSPLKTTPLSVDAGDPLKLTGPFECSAQDCGQELVNAQSVFHHSSYKHSSTPLSDLQVRSH